jgi:hypothetical protein
MRTTIRAAIIGTAAIIGGAAVVPASAAITTVVFSSASCAPMACVDGSAIRKRFGSTAAVALDFGAVAPPGWPGQPPDPGLRFRDWAYPGQGFPGSAGVFSATGHGEISLSVLGGGRIKLLSIDIASTFASMVDFQFNVSGVDSGPWTSRTVGYTPDGAWLRVPFGHVASDTLTVGFITQGDRGGIQNIRFAALPAAVPEPANWTMLIAGFGMVGATLRRRRTVVA